MKRRDWSSAVVRTGILLALLVSSIPTRSARAAGMVVNSNADTTVNNGLCTLREAITNANNNAATWIDCPAGSGVDTITFSGAMTITLTSSLPNITDANLLTINGGTVVTVSGNNLFRIATVTGAGNSAWQNITLQDGSVNGNGGGLVNNGTLTVTNVTFTNDNTNTAGGNDGGAIYAAAGTLNVTNSTFNGNYTQDNGGAIDVIAGTATITGTAFTNNNNAATDDGGALYVTAGTVTVTNCTFTGNVAGATGGAIRMQGGTLGVTNSTFTSNNVTAGNGGAINVTTGGTLTVSNSTFTSNSVTAGDGGAIYHNVATLLTITNSTFTSNRANFAFADGDGGAIYMASAAAGSSATISGSTFSNNQANDDGGALVLASEPVTITSSTFSSNQTFGQNGTSEGGAIYLTNAADSTSIRLSTFSNNSITSTTASTVRGGAISDAGTAFVLANDTFSGNSITKTNAGAGNAQGGAVWTTASAAAETTTIHNVTFSGNSASENGTGTADGGSLYRNAGTTTVANSILTNSTENGVAGNCGGTITNGGNNIAFSAADCGAGFTNINPNLGTLTGSPAYYPLNPASPAIDAGSNAICATAATTNNQSQNGTARPIDGNSDGTATCDIGSYELADASPIVTSITRVNPSPTNLASVNFTVTFSESVSGGGTSNFSLTVTGVSGASITSVSGAGATRTVTVNTGSGDGTIRLDMANSSGVTDGGGNAVISLPFTTGQVYTIDKTGPTVTLNQAVGQADPTNASPINFTVVFSESVTGFDATDVALSGTGAPTTAVVTGSGTTYNVAVSGMSSGTVIANVNAAAVNDAVGNPSSASTSSDNVVGFDITNPSVVSIVRASSDPTAASSVDFTVTFDKSLTGGAASNFNLVTTGVSGASITSVSGSGTTRTVTVNTGSGSGTIRLDMVNSIGVTDGVGNPIASLPFAGETYTVDKTGPTVTIDQAGGQSDPTNTSPINFTVVFSEAVAGFTNTDLTLSGTAVPTTAVVSGGPTTYNVAVSGMSGSGTVIATVSASAVNDSLGNPSSASTSTDNIVTYDVTQPSATSIVRADADPTNAPSVNFTVTFSESVTGVDTGDFNLTTSGVAGASITSVSGSGASYVVTANTGAGSGTIRLNLINNGTIHDLVNNALSGPRIGDETYTIDKTRPTVTINQAAGQADPTNASPINFTATFSEAVTGFDDTGVTLSGTAGATTAAVTEIAPNNGTTYNVAVSGMAGDGTVIAVVDPLSAQDIVGNDNFASTSVDNTVTYDALAPTNISLSSTTIAENNAVNAVIGTLSATDPDVGDTFTFSLACVVPGADDGSFNISGTSLRASASFDFETKNSYAICIRATDSAGNTFDKNFTITITNVNEAPTNISLTSTSIAENNAVNAVIGTLSATDPDAGDTFTFALNCAAPGADDASFNISGTSLRASSSFDFETKNSYAICIRVRDQGGTGLTFDKNFTITITNVNETPTNISLTSPTIAENNAVNAVIGTLSATDPDAGDTFIFALNCTVPGADDASFNISGTSLRASASFDFETKNSYAICIRVRDQGGTGLTFDKNFTITITNVNEAPTNISLSSSSIAENNAVNAVIGTLSATDPDAGDTFTFALTCAVPGADDASFNISGTSLRASASFDFETKNSYAICIRVRDQGGTGLTFDKNFTITITNVNEAPTNISLSSSSIAENNAVNAVIGTLSATDPDAGDTFTFALSCAIPGADDGSFNISGTSLRASSSFDFETKNSYAICIRVRDQGGTGLTFDRNFTVTITNVNEAPTNISLSSSTVAENQPVNTGIGALSATDPDAGATFTFSLTCAVAGADDASFNISGANLRTSASFDFETKNSYAICIRVTDQGGLTFDKNFTVTITNVNEAPTNISLSASSIPENQPSGTVIGNLSATDPDAGDTFSFALSCAVPGADDGAVNISGTSLRASSSFDFETKNSYSICIRVTDQSGTGLTLDKNFTVTVTDVNEAPTNISLSLTSIAENNAVNAMVGALSATDPDAGDTFTFALNCAVPGADDASFNISSTSLRASSSFDFETKSSYSICVRVRDQGGTGLTFDKNFTISITDVNEAPTNISLTSTSIAENQPSGTVIGNLSATDPDVGDTFAFALSCAVPGVDDASFNISGTSLRASSSFDFETKSSYAICIRVADSASNTFDKNFTITVTNVNEAPTDISLSASSIAENQPSGTVIGNLSATDPDAGDTFTFSLTCAAPGADDTSFNISGTNLRASASFDFETKSSYAICIRVTDSASNTFDKNFTINITNVNESPTNIALSNNTVAENQPLNTVVGILTAVDPDSGATFTFGLTCSTPGANDASFNISGTNLQTSAVFDYETQNVYNLCIRVTDQSGATYDKSFTILISNGNDPPTFTSSPVLSAGQNVTYSYNITTADVDGDAMTISAPTLPAWLTLTDNGNGTALLAGTPTAANLGANSVVLQVNDASSFTQQPFTITVSNTPPIVMANGINTIADTGDGVLAEWEVATVAITQFTVTFDQDVFNVPSGDPNFGDSVINPANYMLVRDNGDGFQTTTCALGVDALDTAISVDSVAYSNGGGAGPFVVSLSVNSGLPLSNGNYRLYACGTTSITDLNDPALKLAGDGVTAGTDFVRNFVVSVGASSGGGVNNPPTRDLRRFLIPVTGFAPLQTSTLGTQPRWAAYTLEPSLRVEIPSLGVDMPIVGVPLTGSGWDVRWLANQAGYLDGSAYPTWIGNSVLTAHVTDAFGKPGPFAYINQLRPGDQIIIHNNGEKYVYVVQQQELVAQQNIAAVFRHENYSWITLVTCDNFDKLLKKFLLRRVVRAVLISVISE